MIESVPRERDGEKREISRVLPYGGILIRVSTTRVTGTMRGRPSGDLNSLQGQKSFHLDHDARTGS